MTARSGWPISGVDFTSRPSKQKQITIATGKMRGRAFELADIEEYCEWKTYECWLNRRGPWVAGFDFPFGLPREATRDLGWPATWDELVLHCRSLGRERFRAALDGYRESRAAGSRYAHRATDLPARSHSPLKLVNPPVGLMFLEGAPRLLEAGITIPGLVKGDRLRIAFEAYPGFAARQMVRGSYKNDAPAKQTPQLTRARRAIVAALVSRANPFDIALSASALTLNSLVRDASGDRLDAVLCALQAAWAWQRREHNYGLPSRIDSLEGWIATVAER
ncbi:MAG TPA: DUF429 domain-containing protein [Burkholderiales bacterium]|nr:DUF429 domain-containing protein [Burkholderiales bacterium]